MNLGEYTCKGTIVGLLVHVLKHGTLGLCPLIATMAKVQTRGFTVSMEVQH